MNQKTEYILCLTKTCKLWWFNCLKSCHLTSVSMQILVKIMKYFSTILHFGICMLKRDKKGNLKHRACRKSQLVFLKLIKTVLESCKKLPHIWKAKTWCWLYVAYIRGFCDEESQHIYNFAEVAFHGNQFSHDHIQRLPRCWGLVLIFRHISLHTWCQHLIAKEKGSPSA